MTKFILIGCGQIAEKAHLPALQKLHNEGILELCGVSDLNQDRARELAQRFGVERYSTDWKTLARECNAHAVGICLPPGPNVEVAIAAMEAGLHALCEKPPGRDTAQAQKLAQAAADHPELIGMIAFNRRYAPFYKEAMQRSQKLGQPHTFYGRFTRPAAGQSPSNTVMDWLSSDGSHAIDLAVATLGFPHRVSTSRRCVGSGPDNVWTIQMESPQGGASLIFDFAAGRRVERFEWSGPGYDVMLELPKQGVWAQAGIKEEVWHFETPDRAALATGYGFTGEYEAFNSAIQEKIPRPKADFKYAPELLHLIESLLECPSGQSRAIEPIQSKASPVTTVQSPAATGVNHSHSTVSLRNSTSQQAVVQIAQLPAQQAKFFSTEQLTKLGEQCELHLTCDDDDFDNRLKRTDVLVTGWQALYPTREQLEQATSLKLAIVLGGSVNRLHPDLLIERGIALCSTAEIVARSVAEHCLLLTMAGLRNLCDIDRRMRIGEWPPRPAPVQPPQDFKGRMRHNTRQVARNLKQSARYVPGAKTLKPIFSPGIEKMRNQLISSSPSEGPFNIERHDLYGQTVGLLGWGNSARHYARFLQPFGCHILVYSEHADDAELESFGAKRAALGEVLGSSRVVSVHQGLSERTRNSLGAEELTLLRPGTLLVNTARAEIFNENALLERLQRGDIVAAMDVFHQEPLPLQHPLRSMRNVVLSPHNANVTPECCTNAGRQTLDWIFDWLAGNDVPQLDAKRVANMT